jgi:hypothetical protein
MRRAERPRTAHRGRRVAKERPRGRRVYLEAYEGRLTVNIRTWWYDDQELKPGRAGISIAVKHLPALADGLQAALDRARAEGLLSPSGGGR